MTLIAAPQVTELTGPSRVVPPGDAEKPYRGPHSYQSEDAHLFFGREEATEQVVAKILSSRFMLLHAQSGAGKTSLLNARVLLALEKRGWTPVRALPQDNPAAAVRFEAYRQLLPPPAAETSAINRAVTALSSPKERVTIRELLSRFDALPKRSEDRRRLVEPLAVAPYFPLAPNGVPIVTLPFFCRLLRSSIDVARFDEHIAAVCGEEFRSANDLCAVDLASELGGRGAQSAHASVIAELSTATRLAGFFERWWTVFGAWHRRYAIVLVLDQFEELFTRFADPNPALRSVGKGVVHWRLREAFFDELRELYESTSPSAVAVDDEGAAPRRDAPSLRFVVAIRDEFLAQLDRLRYFIDVDTAKYHLPILHLTEARQAIAQPAAEFGYSYSTNVFSDIVTKLAREASFVEPAHLQVVCERLWEVRGRYLASQDASGGAREIDWETYEKEEMAEGILRNFVADFLNELLPDERLEALEMLEALITPAGTRNIVEWSQLVNPPLRDPQLRERLLGVLQTRTIVRAEWRLGSRFVEITHEFLIDAILRAVRNEIYGDTENARFLDARRALQRVSALDFRRDNSTLLSPREVDLILARVPKVPLSALAAEVLVRSAALHADAVDPNAAARVRACAERYTGTLAGLTPGSAKQSDSHSSPQPALAIRLQTAEYALVPSMSSAAEIVASFLQSPARQIRENAIRALGYLGDEAALELLVHEALLGAPDRRGAAANELLRLNVVDRQVAAGLTCTYLGNPETAARAYAVLGSIHGSGTEVRLPPRSFRDRVKLVRSAAVTERKGARTRRWWRVIEPAMPGGLAGCLIALTFVILVLFDVPQVSTPAGDLDDEALGIIVAFVWELAFGFVFLTPIIAVVASRRSDPIHLHVDQPAASLLEVARAAKATVLSVPGAVVLIVSALYDFEAFADLLVIVLAIAIVAAAVRAGTLVSYEAFTGRANWNRTGQWLTGGCTGLLVASLVAYWMGALDNPMQTIVLGAWIGMFPVCFGLARAFTGAETAAPPVRPIFGTWSRVASGSILALSLGGLFVVALLARRRATPEFVQLLRANADKSVVDSMSAAPLTLGSEGQPGHFTVSRLPSTVRFRVPVQERTTNVPLRVIAPRTLPGSTDLVLELRDSSGRRIDLSDDPPEIDMPVPGGLYYLEVREFQPAGFGPPDIVMAELIRRLGRTPRASLQPFRVITYTPSGEALATRDSVTHLAEAAHEAFMRGEITAAKRPLSLAIAALEPARVASDSIDPFPAELLNIVCWTGALVGESAKVLEICDVAVARGANAYWIVDSRGLARAFTGDREGAIADFEQYVERAPRLEGANIEERRNLRRRWIAQLQEGNRLSIEQVRGDVRRIER